MAISKEVLDELMKSYKGPDDLTGPDGLLSELTKTLIESAIPIRNWGSTLIKKLSFRLKTKSEPRKRGIFYFLTEYHRACK